MADSYRQEVFNVLLAQLLQERGVIAAPENILKSGPEKRRKMPDVIVNFQGLRTVIEGEVDDQHDAQKKALDSARRRVEGGIAFIGVAVVYPERLRQMDFSRLKSELSASSLDIAVVSEAGEEGFTKGSVDYLESALRSAFQRLVEEDVVAKAVATIDGAIDRFASVAMNAAGILGRMAKVLGMEELPVRGKGDETGEKRVKLPQFSAEQKGAVSRIGGLILMNAMIFQETLAQRNHTVRSLSSLVNHVKKKDLMDEEVVITVLLETWADIIERINYHPIFALAIDLDYELTADGYLAEALRVMARAAQKIVQERAALSHDLMGRVYHRLLADAKYLGTYYTTIPSAALLLKLALRSTTQAVEWHDLSKMNEFRVADLSSGTGTLLMAAADALTDNYISASAAGEQTVDLESLHTTLAENVLYGYDVVASVVHLTASTLAMRAPDVTFHKMNLFSLPLGGRFLRLGSIEFLSGRSVEMPYDMFGSLVEVEQVTATQNERVEARLPDLDLCVMNPPFTRSVGGNLLFGSSPDEERQGMQRRLAQMLRQPHILANSNAGLGAVFVAVGDRYIKPGGRIALVLPKALLSGVSWGETRQLINGKYQIEYIVASHDPERWNFSESTNLSEVMLVAKKLTTNGESKEIQDGKVVAINLWRNLQTAYEALALANQLASGEPQEITGSQGSLEILVGKEKIAEISAFSWEKTQANWLLPCAFAQSDLTRAAYHLSEGKLWLPGYGQVGEVKLCSLDQLGSLGPDRRDIHDGFDLSQASTAYPAFWGHDAKAMDTLARKPNQYLSPLTKAKKGRPLRRVESLWPLAGKILISERLRLNTQKVVAIRLSEPVLSNVWWSFSFSVEITNRADKALVLWLNSTPGLLLLLINRGETEGPWVDFKKPTLAAMSVFDLRTLSAEQLESLAATYDHLCDKPLKPLSQMHDDEVRAEIDRSIVETLHLPDFSRLRTLLAREPIICLKRL